jgi:hypothetical protein
LQVALLALILASLEAAWQAISSAMQGDTAFGDWLTSSLPQRLQVSQ